MTTRPSTTSTTTAPSPSTRASPTSPFPCPPPSPSSSPSARSRQRSVPAQRRAAAQPSAHLRVLPPSGDLHRLPRDRYLQLPEQLDPRIPELAQQITGSETSPYLRALAIERYLSTHYDYTLQLPSQPPADPIADFLFHRRRGHCEYFASSMAILLRTVGIPSRIITGFRGAQFNQLNANYIVRASDAHSWVEAYIPGAGWTTFDPTPAGDAAAATLWTRYQLYLDAAREFWREWIVNYDAGHQQALSLAAVRQTRNRVSDFRRWWQPASYHHMLETARRVHHSASSNPRACSAPDSSCSSSCCSSLCPMPSSTSAPAGAPALPGSRRAPPRPSSISA